MKTKGINLHDFGFDTGFLDNTKSISNKRKKIDELDFIKFKDFCASMGTIKNVKIQSTKQKEIYENHISSLVSRIYKELLQQTTKKQTILGKGSEQIFFQRRATNCQQANEKMLYVISH